MKPNKLIESDAMIQRIVSCGVRDPRRSPARCASGDQTEGEHYES